MFDLHHNLTFSTQKSLDSTEPHKMEEYSLSYFPIAGRAEIARIMFHLAGVQFIDNHISFDQWPDMKGDCN